MDSNLAHLPGYDQSLGLNIQGTDAFRVVMRYVRRHLAHLHGRDARLALTNQVHGNHPERVICIRRQRDPLEEPVPG